MPVFVVLLVGVLLIVYFVALVVVLLFVGVVVVVLGVVMVISGGVQRSGKKIRMNIQLIDTSTDANLWAETYTRSLSNENEFIIQSEIAHAIVNDLQVLLSAEEKR